MPKCILTLTCRTRAILGTKGGSLGVQRQKWSPRYIQLQASLFSYATGMIQPVLCRDEILTVYYLSVLDKMCFWGMVVLQVYCTKYEELLGPSR